MTIPAQPIHDSIRAFLLTLDAVTDVVGTAKIRSEVAEQRDAPPWITVSTTRIEHHNTLDGLGGLAKATVEIKLVTESAVDRWDMVEDVRINDTNPGTGLAGYSGIAGENEIHAHLIDTEAGFTPSQDGTERDLYSCLSTYVVEYNETT